MSRMTDKRKVNTVNPKDLAPLFAWIEDGAREAAENNTRPHRSFEFIFEYQDSPFDKDEPFGYKLWIYDFRLGEGFHAKPEEIKDLTPEQINERLQTSKEESEYRQYQS